MSFVVLQIIRLAMQLFVQQLVQASNKIII